MPKARIKIFFDGGCRPNPGTMETAVVARGIVYHRSNCGTGSNNDAEWLALIHAAEIGRLIGANDVVLLGDSAFVIQHASRKAKRQNMNYHAHLDRLQTLIAGFDRIRFRKIVRSQNLAGIALAKAWI